MRAPSADGVLAGRVVLVTRASDQAGALSDRLRALGATPVEAPAIETRPVAEGGPLDRAIVDVATGHVDWVVFPSPNAVRYWFARARALGFDARAVRSQVAAVGPSTAAHLEAHGIVANLVPRAATSEALARAFPSGAGVVVVARTNIASAAFDEALRAKGWRVRRATAYRTIRRRSLPREARALLHAGGVDALAFASASAVEGYARMAGVVNGPKVACIGPVTAKAARDLGFRVDAVARPHTIEGLVAAVVRALRPRR